MKYISFAIIPLVVGFLIPVILNFVKNTRVNGERKFYKEYFTIYNSPKWAGVMTVLVVILTVILVLLNIFNLSNIAANIVIPILIVLFMVGIYACIREKIIIDKNNITVKPAFGKTKLFFLEQIKEVRENIWSNGMRSYSVYSERKLFSVFDTSIGCDLFIELIKEKGIYIKYFE